MNVERIVELLFYIVIIVIVGFILIEVVERLDDGDPGIVFLRGVLQ